jgi:hypothetical protein
MRGARNFVLLAEHLGGAMVHTQTPDPGVTYKKNNLARSVA